MKTIQVNLYKFEELSEEAQQKTLDENRDINTDYYWWTPTEWEFKDQMKELGYEVETMYFSGFSSQGDGACFEGKVYVQDWLKAHKLGNKYKLLLQYVKDYGGIVTIKHSGHYYHEKSMTFTESDELQSFYYLDYERIGEKLGKQIDEVLELIESEAEEKAKELYKKLEDEHDTLSSDDVVKETLINNDYLFLEEGGEIQPEN